MDYIKSRWITTVGVAAMAVTGCSAENKTTPSIIAPENETIFAQALPHAGTSVSYTHLTLPMTPYV